MHPLFSLIQRVRLGPSRGISFTAVSPGGVCQVSLVSLVSAFSTFPYSDITFALHSQREMATTRIRSLGQAVPRSRTPLALHDARSPSIAQRLSHRVVTGRALGITVHQHYGYRLHYTWDGAFGNRCFKRRFPSYGTLCHFCITLTFSVRHLNSAVVPTVRSFSATAL